MRRMKTRQAILFIACVPIFIVVSACSTSNGRIPTQTPVSSTSTSSPTLTLSPSPVPPTPTATPRSCLTDAGEIKQDAIPGSNPLQEFLIYLPPCYIELDDHYPVLYLLHGQTYNQDQWVRLGAPTIADQLIHSGEAPAFIMVFPDDHYFYAPARAGFGDRLINDIIPRVDNNYRTLTDRKYRALGGLSWGGGWTAQLGFEHTEMFGSLGLHSPAIFQDTALFLEDNISNIPQEERPRLWLDIGDADKELGRGRLLDEMFTRTDYLHEFYVFSGDHTETYWGAHAEQYLRWYTEAWRETADQ